MRAAHLAALGAVLAAVAAAGCQTSLPIPGLGGRASDADQVAAVLDDVHRGMQARKANKVMSHVSNAYLDAQGRDYAAIDAYVRHICQAYRDIRITRTDPRIQVQGGEARALEAFGTVAFPGDADRDPAVNVQGQVVVDLRKEDGAWKIVAWGPLQ